MRWNSYLLLAGAVLSATFVPTVASAQDAGDFLIRLRAIGMMPDAKGTTNTLGGNAWVRTEYAPEIDFTYFFTDNIAAELAVSTSNHHVELRNSTIGTLDLGDVRFVPVTAIIQYRFRPDPRLSPYLGVGLNYLIAADESTGSSITSISYSNGFGFAFQAGADLVFDNNWSFNLDLKKLLTATDVSINGGAITAKGTDINPWIVGVGVGYTISP